mgnify:CR=1 FL=1
MRQSAPFLALLSMACAKPAPLPMPVPLDPDRAGVTEPARVPPLDDRDYRIVRLDNGLTAMLVSDPDTTRSAAALAVMAGNLDEPDDRAGLAHFLEHMLFLGTETYPDPEGYGDHLATHGGDSNAWTGDEVTQYYFVVDPGGFDEALHRFSRFFIDPTLDEKYVDKERHAVESEYRLNIEHRWRRWYAAVGQTVHPDHPGGRFSVGSLDTLADRDNNLVVDDLRAFYSRHYTAENMRLALVGTHSLDVLEGQVRAFFADVPQGSQDKPAPDWPAQFRDDQLGVRIDIDQLEDVHSLVLEWPIPEQADVWPDSPTDLLAHVLGDEGPGSLFAQLADRNWLTSLSAGPGDSIGPDGDVFQLDMDLTAEGADHIDDIVAACFAAIQTLRDQPMPAHLAAETTMLQELGFAFGAPQDPGPLTEWLAETMTEHPAERALDAWLTRPIDDPEVLAGLVDLLTAERVRVIVDGQGLEGETAKEAFYDVAWRMRPLEDAEMARFLGGSDLVVSMPPVNPWVPEDTELRTDETTERARLVTDTGNVEVWLAPAAKWQTPKAITQLDLRLSADGFDTPADKVRAWLYSGLLDQHLIDFTYPVELADSEFWMGFRPARFRLHAEGWSDVHAELIAAALAEARAFRPDEAAFDVKKAEYLRAWGNRVHAAPVDLLRDVPYQSIDPEDADYAEWIAILEDTSFADVVAFGESYWRPGALRVLTYGDVDEATARQIAENSAEQLLQGDAGERHDYQQVRWLPEGVERTHEVEVDHDDSAILMLYMGTPGIETHARWGLLGHLLSTPFFQELRTEQQLGYVASAWGFDEQRVPGLQVQIQSSVAGPSVLLDRTDAFLTDWPAALRKMTAGDFETARAAYAEMWREPPSTFHEGWWQRSGPVAWGDGGVDYDHTVADAIDKVQQDELVALAESLFTTDTPTRIVAWAVGRAHADDPLKGTGACADRRCVAEGMEVVFTMDFAHPDPAGVPTPGASRSR